jgi:hypothetical protein
MSYTAHHDRTLIETTLHVESGTPVDVRDIHPDGYPPAVCVFIGRQLNGLKLLGGVAAVRRLLCVALEQVDAVTANREPAAGHQVVWNPAVDRMSHSIAEAQR